MKLLIILYFFSCVVSFAQESHGPSDSIEEQSTSEYEEAESGEIYPPSEEPPEDYEEYNDQENQSAAVD